MSEVSMDNELRFRVCEPRHGGAWCFDLEVSCYGMTRRFYDLRDDSRWWRRLFHRVAKTWRRW